MQLLLKKEKKDKKIGSGFVDLEFVKICHEQVIVAEILNIGTVTAPFHDCLFVSIKYKD